VFGGGGVGGGGGEEEPVKDDETHFMGRIKKILREAMDALLATSEVCTLLVDTCLLSIHSYNYLFIHSFVRSFSHSFNLFILSFILSFT